MCLYLATCIMLHMQIAFYQTRGSHMQQGVLR